MTSQPIKRRCFQWNTLLSRKISIPTPRRMGRETTVWGAIAIGKVINRGERQVFHLVGTGAIPVERVGGRLCARKSKLLAIAG
jgi:hypothetical protein